MNRETGQWLKKLLKLEGNETNMMDERALEDFQRLIVALAKKEHDVRWCSNTLCACHPESTMRYILENNEYLVKELTTMIYYDEFEEFVYSDYQAFTVFN